MLTPSLIVPAKVNSVASEQAYLPHMQDDPTAQKIACGAIVAEGDLVAVCRLQMM
jgi:hypothetical protein